MARKKRRDPDRKKRPESVPNPWLGARVREIRDALGMSQSDLGREAGGFTQTAVYQWEQGNGVLANLYAIAGAFRLDPPSLIDSHARTDDLIVLARAAREREQRIAG